MDIFDGVYYKNCKKFLVYMGLWPYQTDMRRRISETIYIIINMSLVIPLASLLYKMKGKNFNICFENLGSLMFSIACVAKYFVTYTSSQQLIRLFEQIASDWQQITNATEKSILTKYSNDGKFFVTYYQFYVWFAWITYSLMPFTPYFLDAVLPLNESRPLLMPFYADYIVFDQADYHYTSCFHLAFVYLSCAFLVCGVDTTFVMGVQHTCGLFAIICHRLDTPKKESDYVGEVTKIMSEAELRELTIFHNNCLKCFSLLEDSFNFAFLVVNTMSVLGLGLIAVYLLYIYEEFYRFIRIVAFFCGLIMHLLYLNYIGQKIIDSSGDVFLSVYCSKWYDLSNSANLFIKIIMVRAMEPCRLTAGKLSILCMESFGILIKTSVSYFTVILSVT